MDEFIAEIKEEVRRDRLIEVWNQWGNYIIGTVLGVLLITAGLLFWQHRKEAQLYRETAQYEEALDLSKNEHKKEAENKLKNLIQTGSVGYKVLAGFELAKMKINNGQDGEDVYQGVIKNTSIPEVYRQLATYKSIAAKFEKSNVAPLINESQSFFNKSPWLPSFEELRALSFLKEGQDQQANTLFVKLSQDQITPPSLRLRAFAMTEELK
jgi:hypothetical protein